MTVAYQVSVSIRDAVTGLEVFGSPLTRILEADEASGPATYNEPPIDAGAFAPVVPAEVSDVITLLCVTADQELTWRLNGQTDAGITIGEGGIMLLVNCTIDDGVGTNVMVNNDTDDTAVVRVLAVGSDA